MTLRLKLTLLYGGLFLLAGTLLLALNYGLVRNSLLRNDMRIPVRAIALRGTIDPAPEFEEPITEDGRPLSEAIEEYERGVRNAALQDLLVQSGQALALMSVAAVGLGWVMAGRVLRPLHRITATAQRLSEENLHERIALEGPRDELKELADVFDGMLERLDAAFESQRRFVANASHELRTPLSIIRTEVDVALADPSLSVEDLRGMAETVRDATDRSERLIASMLVLARSERGVATSEPVDLSDVVAETLAVGVPDGLVVERDIEPDVMVDGDRALLERLVANLVENAVHYNVDSDGRVDVAVFRSDGRARLRVSNTGPVVPPSEVDGLFEPFRRLGRDRVGKRSGVGLGLSIVRSVARVHHGGVTARARPAGGLEVEVDLPARNGVVAAG